MQAGSYASDGTSTSTYARGRGGPRAWWLRLTTPSERVDNTGDSRAARERQRKAGLTSIVALFVLLTTLLFLQQALEDRTTLFALMASWLMVIIALVLNRIGVQGAAAGLIVLAIDAPVEGALIAAPGGLGTAWTPSLDLFVVALIAAGFILSRRYLPAIVALHIAFILGDYYFLPHSPDLKALVRVWGDSVVWVRPIALEIMVGTLAFLAAGSVDQAIARADRAEDLAYMEHQLAEQSHQLEIGIRQILDTHIRVSNGDISARAPLTQENVLFQIAASLNNLLNRLSRTMQAEYVLQRTSAEIARLRDSLVAARAGRPPLWPAPSGTPVDALLAVLAPTPAGYVPAPDFGRQIAQASVPGQPGTFGQPGLVSAPNSYAQAGGYGQHAAGSGHNGFGPMAGLSGPGAGVPLGSSGRLDRQIGVTPPTGPDAGWMPDGMRPDAGSLGGSSWEMPPLPDWPPLDGRSDSE